MNKILEEQLVVGVKVRLGEKYCNGNRDFNAGDIITLIVGEFEYDNGLYTENHSCPSFWNERLNEFDSIYHLFGNELDKFNDCELAT